MGWAIADLPDGRRFAKRHPLKDPSTPFIREWLTALFPDHNVYSELERCPGSTMVTVYTSQTKDGKGRCGSMLFRWAIKQKG